MRFYRIFFTIVAFLIFGGAAGRESETFSVSPELTASGEISDVLKKHAGVVAEMYTMLAKKMSGMEKPPLTVIYFVPFQEETALQFPVLVKLQQEERWSDKKRRASTHYLGYTYTDQVDGRAIVQMSPDLLRSYYTRDPYGNMTIPNSAAFYAIGHELMHVILMAKLVPEPTQHCVMIESGMVDALISFLEERKLLTYSPFQIRQGEKNSCKASRETIKNIHTDP